MDTQHWDKNSFVFIRSIDKKLSLSFQIVGNSCPKFLTGFHRPLSNNDHLIEIRS